MHSVKLPLVAAGLLLALAAAADGLINRSFTPREMIDKAELVLELKVQPPDDNGRCAAEILKCLKGKSPGERQVIDIGAAADKAITAAAKGVLGKTDDGLALLFVGADDKGEPIAVLHAGGQWLRLDRAEAKNNWNLDLVDGELQQTWAGGTDMLARLSELLVKYPEMDVPVHDGIKWGEPATIAKVGGAVSLAQAVDIFGDGQTCLFIASDAGDKLFQWDSKTNKFQDLTAKLKLDSKSKVSAWGDFFSEGRLDLASWDGRALTIWHQSAEHTFSATAVESPKGECKALAALDVGVPGRAGLLWTAKEGDAGPSGPVLLIPDKAKAGVFTARPLGIGAIAKNLGAVCTSLVADFDGGGLPDIIEVCAKGSLFFKGKALGEFAEATACPIAAGAGRTAAFVGDWAMAGRLDVFTVCEKDKELWQNAGGGNSGSPAGKTGGKESAKNGGKDGGPARFVRTIQLCGEATYIAQPHGIGGCACDFNNDGRQGIFIYYLEGSGPQLFFNRGFRSFGHAHNVDLADNNLLPGIKEGQQAAAVADFNGDAAPDLVVVMPDGTVVFYPNDLGADDSALAVRVALAPGGNYAGPLTVTASNDRRSMGAWVISPGTGEALLSRRTAGKVTFSWQLPGGQPQKKTVALVDKALRFVIPTSP